MLAHFAIGDLVRHRSGGSEMTVSGFEERSVWCSWRTNTYPMSRAFVPEELTIVRRVLLPLKGLRRPL